MSRRALLGQASAFSITGGVARHVGTSAGLLTLAPSRVEAVEPVTIVMAAAAVVGAISSLLSSSGSGGLDPASQAYFERLLANQELISRQINEVNSQLETLATQIAILPPQTITLDRRVRAKGVYHSAVSMEIAFLRAYLTGDPQFGDTDRRVFERVVDSIRVSAGDHIALAQEVGQSIDVVIAVDALRLALGACINSARLAGFAEEGDKRSLEIVRSLVDTAGTTIDSGAYTPTLGSFRSAGAAIRTDLQKTSAAAARFDEDQFYKMNSDVKFFRRVTPTEFTGIAYSYRDVTVWESCGGKFMEPSGQDGVPETNLVFRPGIDAAEFTTAECKGHFSEGTRKSAGPSVVNKAYLETPDDNLSYFVVAVEPIHPASRFVMLIDEFNKVKRREQLHHAADLVLARTLSSVSEMANEIEGLPA